MKTILVAEVFSSLSSMEGGEVVEARRSHSEMGAKYFVIYRYYTKYFDLSVFYKIFCAVNIMQNI